jgi:FixJ family two-component response regulator
VTGIRHLIGVIDDDPSVRGALLRLFRTAGFEVFPFATAEEYLAHPNRAKVECLVIDVRLPGMSGLELLQQMRAEPRPTLMITAHDDPQARNQAQAAGSRGFFPKPFDNRQLLAAVMQALGEGAP